MFVPTETPLPTCPDSPAAASITSTASSCADPSQKTRASASSESSMVVSDLVASPQSTPRSIISISSTSLSQPSSLSTSEGEEPFRATSLTRDPPPRPFDGITGIRRPFLYRSPVQQTPSPPPIITWSTVLSSPPSIISLSSSASSRPSSASSSPISHASQPLTQSSPPTAHPLDDHVLDGHGERYPLRSRHGPSTRTVTDSSLNVGGVDYSPTFWARECNNHRANPQPFAPTFSSRRNCHCRWLSGSQTLWGVINSPSCHRHSTALRLGCSLTGSFMTPESYVATLGLDMVAHPKAKTQFSKPSKASFG